MNSVNDHPIDDDVHPRPQLTRASLTLLDGSCGFAFDDDDRGLTQGWMHAEQPFDRTISLPFSPESAASGIGDTDYHPVVWYRRTISAQDLDGAGLGSQGDRLLVHFGAVDRVADVWLDGVHVGRHDGGYTAFSFDVTDALDTARDEHALVVRAVDDPLDLESPRGKQDWQESQHSIWYARVTGIWRSVWLEAVPATRIESIAWTAAPGSATARAVVHLAGRALEGARVRVVTTEPSGARSEASATVTGDRAIVDVAIEGLRNPQASDEILWSPRHPNLVRAELTIESGDHEVAVDSVGSYFGIRSVAVEGDRLLLNDRPFTVRAVLEQGYWPDSHYTPPSADAIREEVELIKGLGFNSVRIHQKTEDPRFLYWCDRLGLAVWGEAAAAYEFSARAVERFTGEWLAIVRAAISHPSIIVWVPFNESWGVDRLSTDAAPRAFTVGLSQLTRAIDPSRLVVSNDGWEHTDSDLATIHDYEADPEVVSARYASVERVERLLAGIGPAGRRMGHHLSGKPVILSEFGGVRLGAEAEGWGYSVAADEDRFRCQLEELFAAVRAAAGLAGFCYTQLTDTGLETNGLCRADRTPKLPREVIATMVTGEKASARDS